MRPFVVLHQPTVLHLALADTHELREAFPQVGWRCMTPMRPARHLCAVSDAFGKWEAPILGLLAILVGTDAALRDGIAAAPIAFAILLLGLAIWAFRRRGKGGRIAATAVFFGGVAFFAAAESPPPVPAVRYVSTAVFWVAGAMVAFFTWRRNRDGGSAK